MKIAIVKYNAGNVQSVANALGRLGVEFLITNEPEQIKAADKVIFPGVGEANTTMNYLKSKNLDRVIKDLQQPVLGICLGMQLLCSHSEENDTPGLGIFDVTVKKFDNTSGLKVPHMGWNKLTLTNSWLKHDVDQCFVYYVHSYFVPVNEFTSGITEYIVPFSAALKKDNFYAVQFHPEKSATPGEIVLKSFMSL